MDDAGVETSFCPHIKGYQRTRAGTEKHTNTADTHSDHHSDGVTVKEHMEKPISQELKIEMCLLILSPLNEVFAKP